MSLTRRALNEYDDFSKFLMIIGGIMMLAGLPFYLWNYKQFNTEDKVTKACKFFDSQKANPPLDSWGTPLKFTETEQDNLETYSVVSAGKDRKFYTGDDIVSTKQSYKSISRVVGKKTKDAAKGFIRGLFD